MQVGMRPALDIFKNDGPPAANLSEISMNSALYLLNAVALAALVSFNYSSHISSDHRDPAEIHVQASQFVHHPVAQLAVMHAQAGQGFSQAQDTLAQGDEQSPEQGMSAPRTERYTF